jgi:hypothetical protein
MAAAIPATVQPACRFFLYGTCRYGESCKFLHEPHPTREQNAAYRAAKAAEAALKRARLEEKTREDAAYKHTYIISSSLVTFSAGLSIDNIVTGFESCRVKVRGLPMNARHEEVQDLFTQQGIDASHFYVAPLRISGDKKEADVIISSDSGSVIALGLEDIEFRDERLNFEVGVYNGPGGMGSSANRDTNTLKISWRAPAERWVVNYSTYGRALQKIERLNGMMCGGRRLKVEINRPPAGVVLTHFNPNSIRINNFPPGYAIENLPGITPDGQLDTDFSFKRLNNRLNYNLGDAVRSLYDDIRHQRSGHVRGEMEGPDANGIVSVSFNFRSWRRAKRAYDFFHGRPVDYIGSNTFSLRLPTPMMYTITIPAPQYDAQARQWARLHTSIRDPEACDLNIDENVDREFVRLRVSGTVKEAVGILKLKVENLARGEELAKWHHSWNWGTKVDDYLGMLNQTTSAFVRADRVRHVMKVYGRRGQVDIVKRMVQEEVERLALQDDVSLLPIGSISYFVRHGLQSLNETFGEGTAHFDVVSREITIRGGEDVRHALERLKKEALEGQRPIAPPTTPCPVCYTEATAPYKLGSCGHVYCTPCINHFLSNAAETRRFPLACVGDEASCNTPIPIPTIQRFLPKGAFNQLLEIIYTAHIDSNPRLLRYCRTPDCTQVYRCTPGSSTTIHCPACLGSVCPSCHSDGHDGMTCEEWRLHNTAEEQERLADIWMDQQGGRVKRCPECRIYLEKLEGCNHMECR